MAPANGETAGTGTLRIFSAVSAEKIRGRRSQHTDERNQDGSLFHRRSRFAFTLSPDYSKRERMSSEVRTASTISPAFGSLKETPSPIAFGSGSFSLMRTHEGERFIESRHRAHARCALCDKWEAVRLGALNSGGEAEARPKSGAFLKSHFSPRFI